MNNDIEAIKIISETIGKQLLNSNPITGFLVSYVETVKARQAERKLTRCFDMLESLQKDLEESKKQINKEYVKNDDFLDIFEQTVNHVANERNKDKREYFKNILLNSVLKESVDYDATEKYMNILSRLEKEDFIILNVLYQPQLANKNSGNILKNPNQVNGKISGNFQIVRTYDLVSTLEKLLSIGEEQIKDSLYALIRERLIYDNTLSYSLKTNGSQVSVLKDHLTEKGKSFIYYLMKIVSQKSVQLFPIWIHLLTLEVPVRIRRTNLVLKEKRQSMIMLYKAVGLGDFLESTRLKLR